MSMGDHSQNSTTSNLRPSLSLPEYSANRGATEAQLLSELSVDVA